MVTNLRIISPFMLVAALLAGCSGGGGANGAPSESVQAASGIITIDAPPTTSSASRTSRKPSYISTATTTAYLFVDAETTDFTNGSCTSSCTITYNTSAGTHNFSVALGHGATGSATILAEGKKSNFSVAPGSAAGNNFTLILNGAAAQVGWVSDTSIGGGPPLNTITGKYAIADAGGSVITNSPGTATFDNPSVTLSASVLTGTPSPTVSGTQAAPDTLGNDYVFTAACGASATGTFTVAATSGSSSGDLSAGQVAVIGTYPSSTLTTAFGGGWPTYTCTSGAISDSSGTATLQSRHRIP
ncbi:MAG: hypothetical protein WBD74_09405 [Candidatus Aquilonibacter sp.]